MYLALWSASSAALSAALPLPLCHTSALQRRYTAKESANTAGEHTSSMHREWATLLCWELTCTRCCCCCGAADGRGLCPPWRRQPSVRTMQAWSAVACPRVAPAGILEAGPLSHALLCLCAVRCIPLHPRRSGATVVVRVPCLLMLHLSQSASW